MKVNHKESSSSEMILTRNSPVNLQELEKLSWSGVPPSFRSRVWKILCGYLPPGKSDEVVKRKREEYAGYVNQYFNNKEEDIHKDTFRYLADSKTNQRLNLCLQTNSNRRASHVPAGGTVPAAVCPGDGGEDPLHLGHQAPGLGLRPGHQRPRHAIPDGVPSGGTWPKLRNVVNSASVTGLC